MSSIEVEAVTHPRDTGRFVKTWWRVYRDDPHWVPPLFFERKSFFDPARNPYLAHADVQCFVARRGGEDVGTIAATVDHYYQEHEPGVAFFGFFEFVDDLDVARALGSSRMFRFEVRVNNVLDTLYETFGYSYYDDFPARPFAFYWPAATRSVFMGVKLVL